MVALAGKSPAVSQTSARLPPTWAIGRRRHWMREYEMSSSTYRLDTPLASDLDLALRDRTARIGVVGLGTVGLALATFAAARGFRVLGLDVDPVRIKQINARTVPSEFSTMLQEIPAPRIRAFTDSKQIAAADVFFFCIPTPI